MTPEEEHDRLYLALGYEASPLASPLVPKAGFEGVSRHGVYVLLVLAHNGPHTPTAMGRKRRFTRARISQLYAELDLRGPTGPPVRLSKDGRTRPRAISTNGKRFIDRLVRHVKNERSREALAG